MKKYIVTYLEHYLGAFNSKEKAQEFINEYAAKEIEYLEEEDNIEIGLMLSRDFKILEKVFIEKPEFINSIPNYTDVYSTYPNTLNIQDINSSYPNKEYQQFDKFMREHFKNYLKPYLENEKPIDLQSLIFVDTDQLSFIQKVKDSYNLIYGKIGNKKTKEEKIDLIIFATFLVQSDIIELKFETKEECEKRLYNLAKEIIENK